MFNLAVIEALTAPDRSISTAHHALLLRRGFTLAGGAVAMFDDVNDWSSFDSIANDNMRLVGRGRLAVAHPSDGGLFTEIRLPAPTNDNEEL